MKVNDLFNDIKYKDNLNWLEITLSKLYYSNRGYFLRKNMELDEFRNECYIRLFKYWNYNSFNGALNTYLGKVAESTMLNLYQRMDRDSRRLNYDDNMDRIDKEVEEGETPIILKYEDEYLNDEDVIEGKSEYYVSNDKNNPFIYKDKNCTDMVYGAYRSIRKKTVIDGQILYNSIYCIKGES